MKRTGSALSIIALAMVLAVPAAWAAGGKGSLLRSFNSGPNAPQAEGRISPFVAGQCYEADTELGVWVFVVDDDKAALEAASAEFLIDGIPQVEKRTAPKRLAGSDGAWWFAEGVPSIGTLPVGFHSVVMIFDEGDQIVAQSTTFQVGGCGD